MRNAGRRVALAPAWPARGGGGRRRGRRRRRRLHHGGVTGGAAATATADEVVRRRRERESRLQVFRSLMCDLPQTRQSVPPFPSGSAGIKESALGPPSPRSPSPSYKTLPVFRIIPPQPANFLSRERERGGESLSAFGFPDVSSKRRKTCQGRRREGGREKRPR